MKQLDDKKMAGSMASILCLCLTLSVANAAEDYSPFYTGAANKTEVSENQDTGPKGTSVLNISKAAISQEQHPFSGSEKQMDELEKLEPINNNLKVAVDAHNLMNRLWGYKNIQKQYNNAVKLHDKTVELLKDSEECTINYMGRYLNNPVKVWSGQNMTSFPQNHEMRQGLSAWAIAMYEVAKAAEVSPIDVSDVVSVDLQNKEVKDKDGNIISVESTINSSTSTVGVEANGSEGITDISTLHNTANTQVNNLQEQTGGNYFKEPSRQEELEAEDRKADLISRDIGAEVALWMADYLSGSSVKSGPDWTSKDLGGVKKRFPVWTDQKTFYGQYLIRKYKNIKNYIKNYVVPEDVKERIANRIFERQEQYMNIAEKEITRAAVNARLTAQGTYNSQTQEARTEYETASLNIENNKNEQINKLSQEKEQKVASYEEEISKINQKRDEYMTQISDINEENNKLEQEIKDAQEEISHYDSILKATEQTEDQRKEYEELKAKFQAEISTAQAQISEQRAKRDNLQKLYNEQTDLLNKTKQEKTDYENKIQAQIGEINSSAKQEQEKVLETFNQKISGTEKEYKEKVAKIDAAEKAAKAAIDSKSMVTAKQILAQADLVVEDAKEIVYENIEKTLFALQSLGDILYRGEAQDTITSYHQALIESIKGNDSQIMGVKLEGATGKIHDLTNFNTDIVISSYMDEQMRELYLKDYRDLVKNTTILLEVPLFDKMLEGVQIGADDDYFVGSKPKKEDFTAPKAMPDYNLPPLREYVRLDYIDLQNIGKGNAQIEVGSYVSMFPGIESPKKMWKKTESFPITIIDKNKFLSYGGKIPEIWKLMLKDKAFVDSDFYLTSDMIPEEEKEEEIPAEYNPLKLGAEMSPLFRGGIYPCILKDIQGSKGVCNASGMVENGVGIVDVAIINKGKSHANEYYMGLDFVTGEKRNNLLNQGLQECQEVSAKCKMAFGTSSQGFGLITKPYLTLRNQTEESSSNIESFVSEGDASELGSIINIYNGRMLSNQQEVHNVLGYSPYMQSVVNYGERMEELSQQDGTSLSAGEQQNDDIYVRAQYNNNQVGDFLVHVELEQKYKQALDELEEQIKEAKEDLYAGLREFGFEPSAEFDISKSEDYDLAIKQLKSIKENYMSQAKSGIESINPGDSDVLADSQASYRRLYQGLMLDSEAVVSMSMDVDNLSELAEEIKTATTNNAVDEEYEKNGDANFEETLRSLQPAYCAAY